MPVWVDIPLTVFERITGAMTFPVVILVLVAGFVWLFYDQIKKLFSEITERLKESPITFPGGTQMGVPSGDEPPTEDKAHTITQPQTASPAVKTRIEQLRVFLHESGVTDREGLLLQALAEKEFLAFFERVCREIYGSQIRALRALNSANAGIAQESLRDFQSLPVIQSTMTFEQWFQYLATNALVVSQGQNVLITDSGREFLIYVTQQGYPEFGLYPGW